MIYHIEYKDGDSDRENATAHTLASTTASMSVAAAATLRSSGFSLSLSRLLDSTVLNVVQIGRAHV